MELGFLAWVVPLQETLLFLAAQNVCFTISFLWHFFFFAHSFEGTEHVRS